MKTTTNNTKSHIADSQSYSFRQEDIFLNTPCFYLTKHNKTIQNSSRQVAVAKYSYISGKVPCNKMAVFTRHTLSGFNSSILTSPHHLFSTFHDVPRKCAGRALTLLYPYGYGAKSGRIMQFTYYGHACFMVETAGKKLLFDPFISGNDNAKNIDIQSIEADYILLSHGHGDHIADAVAIAKHTGATVIGMPEVTNWIAKQGYDKVVGMNLGLMNTEFGSVRMTPAAHSSGLPDGSYGGNPAGFVITTDDGCFYYTGDTCLIMDMQLIPRYGKLDFAIMPIGGHFTMNPDDAVIATEFVQCNKIIGVHYNTWPPIAIVPEAAQKKFADAGRELLLPAIGETITV